jgi:hypothetical protein
VCEFGFNRIGDFWAKALGFSGVILSSGERSSFRLSPVAFEIFVSAAVVLASSLLPSMPPGLLCSEEPLIESGGEASIGVETSSHCHKAPFVILALTCEREPEACDRDDSGVKRCCCEFDAGVPCEDLDSR